jgi:hypothetical protein
MTLDCRRRMGARRSWRGIRDDTGSEHTNRPITAADANVRQTPVGTAAIDRGNGDAQDAGCLLRRQVLVRKRDSHALPIG